MAYPDKPTGTDIVSENVIFAQGNPNNVPMTDNEIAGGYNDKGEVETDLTSTPTSHKLNKFLFQIHNTIVWLIGMVQELKAEKMSASGGSSQPAMNDLYMGNYRVRQTSDPLLPTDCATKAYVDNQVSMFLGEVKTLCYPYLPQVPEGFEIVPCDGRALSKTTYPELYQIIGGTFGYTDTTFNIPDYRGLFLRGYGVGQKYDVGRVLGQIQASGAPNITGTCGQFKDTSGSADGAFYGRFVQGSSHSGGGGYANTALRFSANLSSPVYQDGLTEIRVTNQAVYYIMRIK